MEEIKKIEYVITQGDMETNPQLFTRGIAEGDKVWVSEEVMGEGVDVLYTIHLEDEIISGLILDLDGVLENEKPQPEPRDEDEEDEDEKAEDDFDGLESVAVVKDHKTVRRYSEKEHGENFVNLARSYAEKIGGVVKA